MWHTSRLRLQPHAQRVQVVRPRGIRVRVDEFNRVDRDVVGWILLKISLKLTLKHLRVACNRHSAHVALEQQRHLRPVVVAQ